MKFYSFHYQQFITKFDQILLSIIENLVDENASSEDNPYAVQKEPVNQIVDAEV